MLELGECSTGGRLQPFLNHLSRSHIKRARDGATLAVSTGTCLSRSFALCSICFSDGTVGFISCSSSNKCLAGNE